VPDDVTIKMLQAEVDNNPDSAGFLFDGFQEHFHRQRP
jgi:adenylate kinase